MSVSPLLILILPLAASLLLAGPQDKKLAVPDAAAQKEAEKVVKDVFKAEYTQKTPAARVALAKKLLQQGVETKDNENLAFLMLREAGDLAALNGEAALALQAITELSKRYQVNALEAKVAALSTAGKTLRTIDEFAALAKTYLALVEEAIAAEDFDVAEKAAAAGSPYAKKGKDLVVLSKLDARSKEAGELRKRTAKVNAAMDALVKNPEDAEAHLLVGQFLVHVKGEWDEGLAHLAKGSDPALKLTAAKDLARPAGAAEQTVAGDAWWDLSEKAAGAAQGRFRSRAAHWYLKARDQLAGINRTRIDKRLETAGMLPPVRPPVDLLKLIDVQKDAINGKWVVSDGKLVSPAIFMARVEIPYTPPEEYDLTLVVECETKQDSLNIGLIAGDARFLAVVDGWDPPMTVLSKIEDQGADEAVYKGRVIVPGQPNTVVCSVRKAKVTVRVNDKVLIDWPADYRRASLENVWGTPNSKALLIGAYLSIFRFTKITLTPVSGEGKRLR